MASSAVRDVVSPRSIILVQRSFRDIVPISHEIGTIFYARLFQKSPELRALFTTDIDAQADKLLQMLAMIVNGLHRLDAFGAAVRESGRRHQDYGVLAKHYELVGETLLWTLEAALQDKFTPAVRAAWTDAYAATHALMAADASEAKSASRSGAGPMTLVR